MRKNTILKIPFFFSLWLLLRLSTSLFAAWFSSTRPITTLEKQLAVWPPAGEIGLWLNRVFLAPWLRWDAIWYVQLLTVGYVAGDGSTSFHPLDIWLSQPLYWLGAEPLFSLLVTSSLTCLGFFWIFYKLACFDLSPGQSRLALLLMATFPASIILFMPYTESAFLFFATLALYQMRQRHWFLAALATCLASLTRQQGVFLVFPMLWFAWEDSGKSITGLAKAWHGWLAACTAPFGLFIWAVYRIYFLREGTLDITNPQGFIYSALLSPSAKQIIDTQEMTWPWTAFLIALPKLMQGPEIGDIMTLGLGVGFVIFFAVAWKYMSPAYRLYSFVIVLVSFCMSTGSFRIYLSLARHVFIAVPVFIGLAAALKQRWLQIFVVVVQVLLSIFLLALYVGKAWIP